MLLEDKAVLICPEYGLPDASPAAAAPWLVNMVKEKYDVQKRTAAVLFFVSGECYYQNLVS